MPSFGIVIAKSIGDELNRAFVKRSDLIAEATTKTMIQIASSWKADARANIAAAGFSKKWQNTLSVTAFPQGGRFSINSAASLRHKIPYAGVFERGAEIRGNPLLWLPLPSVAGMHVGRGRISPAALVASGIPLRTINRPGKPPLLAARIAVARTRRGNIALNSIKLSFSQLQHATSGQFVPLFVGISRVNLRKRFDIASTTKKAQDKLASLYVKNFEAVEAAKG